MQSVTSPFTQRRPSKSNNLAIRRRCQGRKSKTFYFRSIYPILTWCWTCVTCGHPYKLFPYCNRVDLYKYFFCGWVTCTWVTWFSQFCLPILRGKLTSSTRQRRWTELHQIILTNVSKSVPLLQIRIFGLFFTPNPDIRILSGFFLVQVGIGPYTV